MRELNFSSLPPGAHPPQAELSATSTWLAKTALPLIPLRSIPHRLSLIVKLITTFNS
ncbi:uncharacterized protein LACBIDRAFT_306562 [Laccaria bicolor S238N-H82]|uniref:Predicted protein n=1 Tax=Laccaria bicolor (strain S238N-H82 / ATCC MYA-4686) TaxID=486041 RepID=B0DNB5_LACBS|nr:uncharacterized protein LACBIDRAFT_306562 [Laccaria bicolor S238N-H82]EDR03838.1 predicted protein [Laccaria bicolor S238N-H82]|eukprot:XP_001885406.1 predicted protein [Laccaria bicolor S238N-H82]